MFKNFFTIAWRTVWKNKAYAGINILGLSLGIACSLLIFTLVHYHSGFDNFHFAKDRIYRIVTEWHDVTADYSQGTPSPLARAVRNDLDGTEAVARVITYRDLITVHSDNETKKFDEEFAYAEPGFFDIFTFPLVRGDKARALHSPGQALVTEKIAKKYFGTVDAAMGKTLRLANTTDFEVVGVLRDFPVNSDRRQPIYFSYANLGDRNRRLTGDSVWGSVYSQFMTFVRLKPNVGVAQMNKGLDIISKKYQKGRDAGTVVFRLQPLADIHFNGQFDGAVDKKYLWALGLIGLFILITACVNFINLATAQALNRGTEVGIRKVLGGLGRQLFWQFIAETALIAGIAVVIGYSLAITALPAMNSLFKTEISMRFITDPSSIAFAAALLGAVIFLSGSYPGLVLSRFQPVQALKSKLSQKQVGGFSLRRILVIAQFAISQMLIIGAIVVAGQLHYVRTTDLGFKKDAIVLLPVPRNSPAELSSLDVRLRAIPGVDALSMCQAPPASEMTNSTNARFDNRSEDEHFEVFTKGGDDRYLSTFGLHLIAGRNFFPGDSAIEFVVNETLVRKMNLREPADILGRRLRIGSKVSGPIVGVVKDFYSQSLHGDMTAVAILPARINYNICAVKLNPANLRGSLSSIQKLWNGVFPDYLYSYKFLDDSIAEFYETDNSLLTMIGIFAVIAIFIGCLGLYGLTSFMAVRKTKEIGVRKVLGAGIPSILWLFGREFVRLLVMAFLIAAPLAGWVMHRYLLDFKYRISIGPGIFLLSIATTTLVVLMTVSYQSLRSALANPVTALRSE
jgi:predicted permease